MPKAIIVGCNGQDGMLLFDLLAAKGYALLGVARDAVRSHGSAWSAPLDIGDPESVGRVIAEVQPDEVYYLAAYHHTAEDDVGSDSELFRRSLDVNFHGLVNFLDAIYRYSPATRLFYAASSHVFGDPASEYQDEQTPLDPVCAYGISKAAGMHACRFYRSFRSVFAATGILYNHESSLRDMRFISQKIIRGAIEIRNGTRDKLLIGNPQAVVDWGYAPDYVDAMRRILRHEHPDDFVIATGVRHTVQEFFETVFGLLGLEWQKYVSTDPTLLKKKSRVLIGKPNKLYRATGWRAETTFHDMIRLMVNDRIEAERIRSRS